MKLLYLGILLVNLTFIMASYVYKINGINRSILQTPHSILETSVPLTMQKEEVTLYYDQETLKNNYEKYLDSELKKYTEDYVVSYYFYNTNDGGFCDVTNCQGVVIKVEAKVMLGITYKREMKYEITESIYYGKKSNN